MTLWTLIPAKPFDGAKGRLAGVLPPPVRAALAEALLVRTIRIVRRGIGAGPLAIVSSADAVRAIAARERAAARIVAPSGLNGELAAAAATIPADDALLVIHGDLPLLDGQDVAALVDDPAEVVIAPDRAGRGTNALLYRGGERVFAFGADSCRAHLDSAAGRATRLIERPGLAFDLDERADWMALCRLYGTDDPALLLAHLRTNA